MNSNEPYMKRNMTIRENGANGNRKLFTAGLTLPDTFSNGCLALGLRCELVGFSTTPQCGQITPSAQRNCSINSLLHLRLKLICYIHQIHFVSSNGSDHITDVGLSSI
jgi:hypothetical protein